MKNSKADRTKLKGEIWHISPKRRKRTDQVHKWLATEQMKVPSRGYCRGLLAESSSKEVLGIGRSWFLALLNEYRHDPEGFSITYEKESQTRLLARFEM